ncbi:hypothetical protein D9758_008235 [Tetrapyrgos nigripes]|uniref:F-box domain-containing protein n=1 Tax=Tetrapyrgos nigripes TaxID=182062 RepID=A0A8H5G1D3_9AGAR|nr:hypothetical protein D9758_008235 [Tetrapyrgos nigripes]
MYSRRVSRVSHPATTMSCFPAEIIDHIVDFLDDDAFTLCNISIVSSQWLPSGRARLFRAAKVNQETFGRFLDLLAHPLSTFSMSVKHINIDGQNQPYPESLRQDVSKIGERCPNIVSVYLSNLTFTDIEPGHHSSLLNAFPNVTILCLDGITFISVSQMMSIFCGIPLLREGSLINLIWDDPSTNEEEGLYSYKIPSSLRELRLEDCYKRDVLKCFLRHDPFPPITTLDVGVLSPTDTQVLGEYLMRLGSSLNHFSLGFSSFDAGGDAEDFYHNCDLSHNVSLQSITFHRLIDYWKYRLTSPVPWNLKTLSQIQSDVFQEISFSIYLDYLIELLAFPIDFDWGEMDRFFTEGNLPHLRVVRFTLFIGHQVDLHEATRTLGVYLPLTMEKRILRVEIHRSNI